MVNIQRILVAWHRRQVHRHIEQRTTIRHQTGSAGDWLEAGLEGNSAVDESMLTSESLPVDKAPGARVFAGTLNQCA